MNYQALIPVKTLIRAKSRLAPYLNQQQREKLVLEMLRHVIEVLTQCQQLGQVSVVSADRQVLQLARSWGARPLVEELVGHNSALFAAAKRLTAEGAEALLTISGDLPLLSVEDVETLILKLQHADVVLAPSRDGTGTNALLVRPPLVVPYLFGVDSLERYLRAARYRGLKADIYCSEALGLDIDTVDDMRVFDKVNSGCSLCSLAS